MGLVGSSAKLGSWKAPIKMDGKSYPLWRASVDLDASDGSLQYKYCVVGNDGNIKSWESGSDNRVLAADILAAGKRHDGQFNGGGGHTAG